MSHKNIPPTSSAAIKPDHHLDWDIGCLRKLIHQAAAKNRDSLNLEEQPKLHDTVGKSTTLPRLLKTRRELAGQGLDPAARLIQALDNLEEEWPQLTKIIEKFSK
jgi:hypothetical protein